MRFCLPAGTLSAGPGAPATAVLLFVLAVVCPGTDVSACKTDRKQPDRWTASRGHAGQYRGRHSVFPGHGPESRAWRARAGTDRRVGPDAGKHVAGPLAGPGPRFSF